MVDVFVEGGGDSVAQRKRLRVALGQWIENAIPQARGKVKVRPSGGRATAFKKFCEAMTNGGQVLPILLVDSESKVKAERWKHVHARIGDGWTSPPGATEDHLHFMCQTMKTWLCADPTGLQEYFGQGFKPEKLPQSTTLETVTKSDINSKLDNATKSSKRGSYQKGRDLGLIARLSPSEIQRRCPMAKLFIEEVRNRVLRRGATGQPATA